MLAPKLILVPALIGAVSLAGRKWGPAVSGWLAGFPFTSGPVVLILALEQGTAFAARAARGTLMGLVSVAVFCLAYAWLSRRFGWITSMLGGWGAFLVSTAILDQMDSVPLVPAFTAVVIAVALSYNSLPALGAMEMPPSLPWWDIPVRMVAATALVVGITEGAAQLGPQLSGLLTPFPIYATVMAVFTHALQGPEAATRVLRGVILGLFTFAGFFFMAAGRVEVWGLAATFTLALAAALGIHAGALWFIRTRIDAR
jgi:hypothetical protein